MFVIRAAALAAAILISACQTVPEVPTAPPAPLCEQTWTQFRAQMPPHLETAELADEARDVFVAALNRIEPPSDYKPDTVFILHHQSLSQSMVVLVERTCVIFAMPIPNRVLGQILQGMVPGKQRGA